jgi:hypothetical protein
MPGAVQPCSAGTCPQLRAEEAKLKRAQVDGKLAAAAYQPPGQRTDLPPGYSEATPEQLHQMNLSPDMLEHPKNAKGEETNFRAAVFVNNDTGERTIAFKGSADPFSLSGNTDWGNNLRQGMGKDAYYYTQAQTISNNVAASPFGDSTHYTGHSLGGGLASAASRASGAPATTFNAASLNKDTVPQPDMSGTIDAVSVRGDPLTRLNEGMLGTTANTEPYKLDPPDDLGAGIAKNIPWWNLKEKAKAAAARQLELHSMSTVNKAMDKRAKQVQAALVANKC